MPKLLPALLAALTLLSCKSQEPVATPPTVEQNNETPEPINFASSKAMKVRTDLPYYATQAVASVNGKLISAEKFNQQVEISFDRLGYDPKYKDDTCGERLKALRTIDDVFKHVVDFELVRQASEGKMDEVTDVYVEHRFELSTSRGGWAFTHQEPYYAAQLEEMEYIAQATTKQGHQDFLRVSESMVLWLAEHPSIQSSVGYQQQKGTFKTPEIFVVQRLSIPKANKAVHERLRKSVDKRLSEGSSFESIAKSVEPTHPVAGRPFYWTGSDGLKTGDIFEKVEKVGPFERFSIYRVVKLIPSKALSGKEEERAMARQVVERRFHDLLADVGAELRKTQQVILNRDGIKMTQPAPCPSNRQVRISEEEAWETAKSHLNSHGVDTQRVTYEISKSGYGARLQKDFRFIIKSRKLGVRLVDVDGYSKVIRRSIILSK